MQFKVPQNVQIEDKILPFMTLRQLVICGVGGGVTYVVYLMLERQNPEIWMPPVAILALLTLAIAFLKIQGIPFIQYMFLLLERYLTEQKRIWVKSAGDIRMPTDTKQKKAKKKKPVKKKATVQDIEKISRMLDEGEGNNSNSN